MDIVSSELELAPRVQNGLDSVQQGRFREKELWNVPLSVLDEETRKLTLVKRKALAVRNVLSEMPIRIESYELIVGFSVHNSVANITPFPEYATQEERAEAAGKYTGTFSVFGHFCPSYPKYLRLGVGGLRRQAEEKLSEIRRNGGDAEKEDWIESAMIALDGLRDLMLRYGSLASELSEGGSRSVTQGGVERDRRDFELPVSRTSAFLPRGLAGSLVCAHRLREHLELHVHGKVRSESVALFET